jgi:hypothetical protein
MRSLQSLVYALLLAAIFCCGCNAERQPQCKISIDQSPEVKGLRLGMTSDQIRKRFPQFKETKADELEFSDTFLINGKPDYKAPEGIEVKNLDSMMVRLGMLKGRLISIASYNPPNTAGISLETYQARVPESLKIPYKLGQDPQSSDYLSLTCDGFKVKSGQERLRYEGDFLPTSYWFYSIEDTAAVAALGQQRKQMEAEKEKLGRQERERRAREFKP